MAARRLLPRIHSFCGRCRGYTFLREFWNSASTTAFELESREEDFRNLHNWTASKRLIHRLVLCQKLILSAVPLVAAILSTKMLILPLLYIRIDPTLRPAFTFDLANVWLVYLPPAFHAAFGIVASRLFASRMKQSFPQRMRKKSGTKKPARKFVV